MKTDLALNRIDRTLNVLVERLLQCRAAPDHWDGHLSSSALSTGTAVLALDLAARNGPPELTRLRPLVNAGVQWLIAHQNEDGGWGDTVHSRSNISTTLIVWATLDYAEGSSADFADYADKSDCAGKTLDVDRAASIQRAAEWLRRAASDTTPDALRAAILKRYGKDRTFSVPILTVLALCGKLGMPATAAWRSIPQLPFELAALPHAWFQHLRLPVVSYALPALIAIGQVRHHFAPSRNPATRALRGAVRDRTHRVLREMQPASGGYLEATPLTSFVVMSLAGMGWTSSPVVDAGVRFLTDSMRPDGSWPIDTNLATWVTTLSVNALSDAETLLEPAAVRDWLLQQQSATEHPFTHAAPGGWAWTPLSGGVPDADDTSGALVALRRRGPPDEASRQAAAAGVRWLLGVQNRDGGVPTFCRGWGTLPFDRSTPEITAHALQAWSAWFDQLDAPLQREVTAAAGRAVRFLENEQRGDGRWIPLWFGNEHAPEEENPTYGTTRVLLGLHTSLARGAPPAVRARQRAVGWLLRAQNADGGWGGAPDVESSIEETGAALSALGLCRDDGDEAVVHEAVTRGAAWLVGATADGTRVPAAPIGLYFARLWYYEDLYPLIFAIEGLSAARGTPRVPPR